MKKEQRNLDILKLALEGATYKSIADMYGLSGGTVAQLVGRTLQKHYPSEFATAIELTREAGLKRCLYPSIEIVRERLNHVALSRYTS